MSVTRSTAPDPHDPFADPFTAPGPGPDPNPFAPTDEVSSPINDGIGDHPVGVDSDGDSVPLDIEKVRLYQRLRDAQAAADEEAGALKEEADKLQEELIAMFSENGLQNLNVDGRTVYLHRSIFAQRKPGVTAADVQAALRAAGVGDLIKETVNGNTLNAYVRELTEDDDAEGLPPEVAEVLEPGERYRIGIVKK